MPEAITAPPAAPPSQPVLDTPSSSQIPDSAPLNDSFSSLDGYLTDGDAPGDAPAIPPAPPEKPDTNGKPAEPAAPPAKPATPPASQTSPPAKPAEDPPIERMAPKQLREAYTKTRDQVKTLEAKLKELESKPVVPADDSEKKQLAERLSEREARLAEIQKERDFTDYEQSQEYLDKYWKPYTSIFSAGRARAASLTVTDDSGETRPGSPEDFDEIMKIADPGAAGMKATELFGSNAASVLYHRERVIEANEQRINALDTFKATHATRTKEMAEQRQKSEAERNTTFRALVDEAVTKFPHWFKPTEGESLDPKANELLEKGNALADAAFSGGLPPQEAVKLHSVIRNKAGAFDRVAYELAKARKELAAAKAELGEIKASTPTLTGQGKRGGRVSDELNWSAGLDRIATAD